MFLHQTLSVIIGFKVIDQCQWLFSMIGINLLHLHTFSNVTVILSNDPLCRCVSVDVEPSEQRLLENVQNRLFMIENSVS